MSSTDDRRRIRFWQPDTPSVTGMLRVEHEDRTQITYVEHFAVVVVYEGAFDGWYRGGVRTHLAGSLKLKEPGEVHRNLRVHAPFTLQGATFAPELRRETPRLPGPDRPRLAPRPFTHHRPNPRHQLGRPPRTELGRPAASPSRPTKWQRSPSRDKNA